MADFVMDDENLEHLEQIAAREARPMNDVLRTALKKYDEQPSSNETEAIQTMLDSFDKRATETSPLEALIGMFADVEASDLSMKASGPMGEYFVKKHDDPA
jgi:hypothetical protein